MTGHVTTEAQTRAERIDHQLARAGWATGSRMVLTEHLLSGRKDNLVRESAALTERCGNEILDYILLDVHKRPLALVEALHQPPFTGIGRDAQAAAAFIEEALRIAAAAAEHRCQRCNAAVTADEFERSGQAFQRVFCDRCFDEVFLERRNFETQVELNKTIEARDGTVVQSEGERRIAVYPADLPRMNALLAAKLRLLGYSIGIDARSEVSASIP